MIFFGYEQVSSSKIMALALVMRLVRTLLPSLSLFRTTLRHTSFRV